MLEKAAQINPDLICKYVENRNWCKITDKHGTFYHYQKHIASGDVQITIPKKKSMSNYANMVYQTCIHLSIYENQSFEITVTELMGNCG